MTPTTALLTATILLLSVSALPAAAAPAVDPGEHLLVEGVPPIPREVVDLARPYTEIRRASFASWHPDRREMLVSTRFGETTQIHRVERPLGARTQLTFFPEPVRWASYDPREGRSFVFSRDAGGDEFYQLYRFDLETGTTTLLTDGEKRHSPGPWSNGGDLFAFEKVDAGPGGAFTEIWVADPRRPETRRMLTTLDGGGWSVTDWSPDDAALLLRERISAHDSRLWRLDVASGAERRVTPEAAAEKVAWGAGRFSADGATVFTTTDAGSEFRRLAALRLADGALEILTGDIPWDVTDFDLSRDGSTLAFLTNEAGFSRLYLLDVAMGERRAVSSLPEGVAGGLDWHDDGRHLALHLSSARSSRDVWVLDAETGEAERWTRSETGGLDAERFVEPTLIEWTSFDGRRITGFLYQPDAERFRGRRPVIVDIHGGPESQERPGFKGKDNIWSSELGIAVIYPNVRGSSGFGKSFLQLDNGMLREGSYEDVRALLDWIAKNPHLDSDRVMVTGGSYGGHMTFAVATRYSDRIRCSVPVVGISNLRTFLENTQGYRRDLRRVEYGDERDHEMYAFLERIAPLEHAEKITKPIFIIHGRNDPRVPVTESEQIVQEVRAHDVEAWFLVAEDEGHGFRKKSNRDFQLYATVLFVEQFLLGESGAGVLEVD